MFCVSALKRPGPLILRSLLSTFREVRRSERGCALSRPVLPNRCKIMRFCSFAQVRAFVPYGLRQACLCLRFCQ